MSESLLADVDQNSYAADHDVDTVKTLETVNTVCVFNSASGIAETILDVVKGSENNVTPENPEKKFDNISIEDFLDAEPPFDLADKYDLLSRKTSIFGLRIPTPFIDAFVLFLVSAMQVTRFLSYCPWRSLKLVLSPPRWSHLVWRVRSLRCHTPVFACSLHYLVCGVCSVVTLSTLLSMAIFVLGWDYVMKKMVYYRMLRYRIVIDYCNDSSLKSVVMYGYGVLIICVLTLWGMGAPLDSIYAVLIVLVTSMIRYQGLLSPESTLVPLSAILQFKGQPSFTAARVTTSTTSADDTSTVVVVAADVAVTSVPTRAESANRVKEWFQTLLVLSENDYRLFLSVYTGDIYDFREIARELHRDQWRASAVTAAAQLETMGFVEAGMAYFQEGREFRPRALIMRAMFFVLQHVRFIDPTELVRLMAVSSATAAVGAGMAAYGFARLVINPEYH